MSKIPKIKKKVGAFLVGEEGKIKKKSLVKMGMVLSSASIGTMLASEDVAANSHANWTSSSGPQHENAYTLDYDDWVATISHANHGNSYYSHHTQHSSGGWC